MSCEFTQLKHDFTALIAIICVAALLVVGLDVFVWRKAAPEFKSNCVKPELRNAKAIATYLTGCPK